MSALVVLCVSLLLQVAAAGVAVRLAAVVGRRWAWLALALAILLMAARRLVSLGAALGEDGRPLDPVAESIALGISALMLAGLLGLLLSLRGEQAAVAERQRAAERLAKLVEQSTDGIFLASPEGRYIEANASGCAMLGYAREELLGLTLNDVLAPVERPGHTERLDALRVSGQLATERLLQRKDGSTFLAEIRGRVLEDGTFQGTVRDVSERRRAEEELQRTTETLRALFDSAPVAITVVDPHGNLSGWNAKAEELFEWTAAEVLGRPLPIVPPEGVQEHEKIRRKLLAGRPGVVGAIVQRRRKDGQLLTLRLDTAPVRGPDGSVRGTVGILADLTQQTALEERLRQGQKMEAIGQLAGGIAHDFNNLLTAVAGYAELLSGSVAPGSPAARQVGHILGAARRAAELTQQLLAFGRRQVLKPRLVDLRRVVADVVPLLDRLLGENVRLEVQSREKVPPVLADPTQLQQVIINLAVNARDAMPDGGQLTLLVEECGPPSSEESSGDDESWTSWVALRVTDTGEGIPEELRKQIFEPFFTTKEHGRGTGLGLATVYGIVRQSGGVVQMKSRVGMGTTFSVLLPAACGTPEEEAAPSGATVLPASGSERLLVVEDEGGVRDLVLEVLRGAGYQVTSATSAEEALDLLDGREPLDLVVTDVVLPHMNGRQLADEVRRRHPEARVLFMSGYADTAIISPQALGPGEHFMQKPFRTGQLAARVREALDTPAERE